MGDLDPAQGDDQAPARGGKMGPRHAGWPREPAGGPHAPSLSERRLYAVHHLRQQRPGIDRLRDNERLCRPAQPGHDPPLLANADKDEGGRPACIGNSVSLGSGPRCARCKTSSLLDRWRRCGVWNVFRADGTEPFHSPSGRFDPVSASEQATAPAERPEWARSGPGEIGPGFTRGPMTAGSNRPSRAATAISRSFFFVAAERPPKAFTWSWYATARIRRPRRSDRGAG